MTELDVVEVLDFIRVLELKDITPNYVTLDYFVGKMYAEFGRYVINNIQACIDSLHNSGYIKYDSGWTLTDIGHMAATKDLTPAVWQFICVVRGD